MKYLIGIVVLVLIIVYGAYELWNEERVAPVPTTFAECAATGGAIMKSYPEQCRWKDQTFENDVQQVLADDLTSNPQPPTSNFSDWQTYRNEEYGFEIKHPQGWTLEANEESSSWNGRTTLAMYSWEKPYEPNEPWRGEFIGFTMTVYAPESDKPLAPEGTTLKERGGRYFLLDGRMIDVPGAVDGFFSTFRFLD